MSQFQKELEQQASIIYAQCQFDNNSEHQLRLLSLHAPTYANSPLIGELAVKNTKDDDMQYTALSYAWGDENIRELITINGVDTTITKQLAEALHRLRSEGKAQDLWADAICINQHDGGEKSIQVAKMGQIFSNAARTYLWLGEESGASNLAMDLVADITEEKVRNFDPLAAEWRGLYDLLRRPWWSRLWVIQEAVLSPQPIFKCGAREAHMNLFCDTWSYWDLYEWKEGYFEKFQLLDIFHELPFMMLLSHDTTKWVGVGLNSWVVRSTDFECKYMRDRVFGILSLAGPFAKQSIQVTYERDPITNDFVKSDRRVMQEAGVVVFQEVRALTPLLLSQERHTPSLELPSWCPDFTRGTKLNSLGHTVKGAFPLEHFDEKNSIISPWHLHREDYKGSSLQCNVLYAGWQSQTDSNTKIQASSTWGSAFAFSEDSEVMAVRGFVVDKVDFAGVTPWIEVGNTLEERERSKVLRASLTLDAVREWEHHVETNKTRSYPLTGWKEAFWRTLITNRGFDLDNSQSSVPDSSWELCFDAWLGRGSNAGDEKAILKYRRPAIVRCAKFAFITTENGYFGIAPAIPKQDKPQKEDLVCILRGAEWPCILREIPETNFYTFMGFAYVHGIMGGEHLLQVKVEELREFWLK